MAFHHKFFVTIGIFFLVAGLWAMKPRKSSRYVEEAVWTDPLSSAKFTYRRQPMPQTPFAEFTRTLVVEGGDGATTLALKSDTGGLQQMNVYRGLAGELVFRDHFGHYAVAKGKFILPPPRENFTRSKLTYIGRFDHDKKTRLVFMAADTASENEIK